MSRTESFGEGSGRPTTPEGWMRVRANTVYGKAPADAPLVAIPKSDIKRISQEHDGDHVLGYVMQHGGGNGRNGLEDRAFTLHTAKGATTVELRARAWMYLHHGQPSS